MIDTVAEQAFAPALAAVEAGRIPGAALGVVTADGMSAVRVAGLARRVPDAVPLTRAHWFDLASVSKVIATTSFVLALAEEGRIDLDRPLTDAIPDLRQYDVANAAERRLTFRDCLVHRTFLPAVEPIYTYGDDPARLRAFVLQREWRHGPPVYSGLCFLAFVDLGQSVQIQRIGPLGRNPCDRTEQFQRAVLDQVGAVGDWGHKPGRRII